MKRPSRFAIQLGGTATSLAVSVGLRWLQPYVQSGGNPDVWFIGALLVGLMLTLTFASAIRDRDLDEKITAIPDLVTQGIKLKTYYSMAETNVYLRDVLPLTNHVRNTNIRGFGRTNEAAMADYENEYAPEIIALVASFLASGLDKQWSDILSVDLKDRANVVRGKLTEEQKKRYHVRFVVAPVPLTNFILLEGKKKPAELLFGFGQNDNQVAVSIFGSANPEIVEHFSGLFTAMSSNQFSTAG